MLANRLVKQTWVPMLLAWTAAFFSYAVPAMAQEKKDEQTKPAKQTSLKISKETTFIVQPLTDEGYVDYVAAANEMNSKGVTPTNNYEVVMRRVLGPKEIGVISDEYHRMLGIDVPKPPFMPRIQVDIDEFERALDGPWESKDCPGVDRFLTKNATFLDALVEGSRLTGYYIPYVSPGDDPNMPRMIAVLLPSVQSQRAIARLLTMRCNLRINDGDLDGAWSDTIAMYRMSRHCGKGMTLIEMLVGCALDSMAFNNASRILDHELLTDVLCKQMWKDISALPEPSSVAEKISLGERLMGLDAMQTMSRATNPIKAFGMLRDLSGMNPPREEKLVVFQGPAPEEKQKQKLANQAQGAAEFGIDWNVAAVMMNRWYDRLGKAATEENYLKRRALHDAINADIEKLRKSVPQSAAGMIWKAAGGKKAMGETFGSILVTLLIPAVDAATRAHMEAIQRNDILKIAIAAETVYKRSGRYPEKLENLIPEFIEKVPPDRLSPKPLTYRTSERSMVVYSLGRNAKDDLGRGYSDHGDREDVSWDDVVVRIKN